MYGRTSLCPWCLLGASIPQGWEERTAMLNSNLRKGNKNPGTTNTYTKFGQLIIRKSLKLLPLDATFEG